MSTATPVAIHKLSAAPEPQRRVFYAPELDALRFLAFILVFFRHVAGVLGNTLRSAHGTAAIATAVGTTSAPPVRDSFSLGAIQSLDFGVCLFFFLSSFLITRLLLIEKSSSGTVAVRDFYVRRCLRIWPLYFFFLALIGLCSLLVPVLHVTAGRMLVSVLFIANWAAVLHGWASISIQPLWSVSVEEQFYLVWPNFARYGRSAIIGVSVALAAVSVGTLIYLGHRAGTEVTATWPNTLVQALFLSAGALTACLSSPETRTISLLARLVLGVGGFACWVLAGGGLHIVATHSPGTLNLVGGYLLVLLGTFALFTAVAGWDRGAVPKSLVYLGKISYGLYVFHVASLLVTEDLMDRTALAHHSPYLLVGAIGVAGLALTVTCAVLSYTCLEKPFLKLKKRFTVVASRPV
ncbi:MAG TPA: acyltransferase [Acidisarcina sp.]